MAATQRNKEHKEIRLTSRARLILERVAGSKDEPVLWPPSIKAALDELTPKQRHFCVCVGSGMSNAQAYKRAYDVAETKELKDLCSDANTLASLPHISSTIELLLAWLDRQWLLESSSVIEYGYGRLYEEAEYAPDSGDRIRAATNLLKAHGAFVSRSEVRHIHSVDTNSLDTLLSGVGSLLGVGVPISIPQIDQPVVANKGFIDAEYTVPDAIGIGTDEADKPDAGEADK